MSIYPSYPIRTTRLLLRPFQADDLDDLYEMRSHPEVVRYLYWDVQTLTETKEALETKIKLTRFTAEGDTIVLAVVHGESRRVIGEVSLFWHSEMHQQGEVGFVFHPAFQGKGYASEATKAILAIGFEQYRLHRIYGSCDARNVSSYKLMARLGMRREAYFIHNEIFKGEWGDEFVYAMLQDEWLARKEISYEQRDSKGSDAM
jgi:RimJ/RimL family protein N-acetyltransferase